MLINGLLILTTFFAVNEPVINQDSEITTSIKFDFNYNNLQNYDLLNTKILIENPKVNNGSVPITNYVDADSPGSINANLINNQDGESTIKYQNGKYENSNIIIENPIDFTSSANDLLSLKLFLTDNESDTPAIITSFTYDNIYLVATQNSENAGEQIVGGITAGLGLMNPIANEFLTGFSTLFWNSTLNDGAGGLTTFGNFALIFMGVSITFAVVKLALNLIRGKTGA